MSRRNHFIWIIIILLIIYCAISTVVHFNRQQKQESRQLERASQRQAPQYVKFDSKVVITTTRANFVSKIESNSKRSEIASNSIEDIIRQENKAFNDGTKTSRKQNVVIPKRIHFIYKDSLVPSMYRSLVKTWTTNHPDWETWFWTDADVKQFIQDKYPTHLDLYLHYKHGLQKSDCSRYLILHQYGGVYADMDMLSIKPIGPLLEDKSCVFSPEPPVQTQMIFNYSSSLTNSLMACAPGHPFMEHVISELLQISKSKPDDVLATTGPFFLNATYQSYSNENPQCVSQSQSNIAQSSDMSTNHVNANCHVTIVDYKYMCPTMDSVILQTHKDFCLSEAESKPYYKKLACEQLKKMKFTAPPLPREAYAEHKWYHFGWSSDQEKRRRAAKHISSILPHARRYLSKDRPTTKPKKEQL